MIATLVFIISLHFAVDIGCDTDMVHAKRRENRSFNILFSVVYAVVFVVFVSGLFGIVMGGVHYAMTLVSTKLRNRFEASVSRYDSQLVFGIYHGILLVAALIIARITIMGV